MSGHDDGGIDFQLYRYTPSLVAAIIFIVLFTLTTAHHLWQTVRARCWYFLVFVTGGIFQIIGYICRALAHSNKESVPIYSVGTILILLAPPLYAASIYMTLGRLIGYLDAEKLSPVSTKWLTTIFVMGDVIAFLAQGAGGGIMAMGTVSAMNTGENVTIAGLCVQLVFFSIFIIVATIFHYRLRKNPTSRSTGASLFPRSWREATWETVMLGLYGASVLILIRSIFRLIEYAQGNDGYLISHEVFMYVFDATLMFITMVGMSFFHPSKVLSPLAKAEAPLDRSYTMTTQLCDESV
ncbi:RTA1 like protein-domain-containing protein [Aspergillus pseudotamarii]|uniref:RTA1 like protein-domain-containing protein n=1 Tax=Aspergillus pseudotamarii TaxID=132259 RepID=A0A5N6T909_ASPPS|nr:RTA1 like protein-domain-containing protein [Aspergillus pseudotamarii]KAE8142858.1 RTA1 like protein-domain-containing protein [Aspergillus pseudotamarii]